MYSTRGAVAVREGDPPVRCRAWEVLPVGAKVVADEESMSDLPLARGLVSRHPAQTRMQILCGEGGVIVGGAKGSGAVKVVGGGQCL